MCARALYQRLIKILFKFLSALHLSDNRFFFARLSREYLIIVLECVVCRIHPFLLKYFFITSVQVVNFVKSCLVYFHEEV